ncbi:MAG: hypothetical protein ACOYBW_11445 [Fluviibacter phosphoraccumulans]
MRIVEFASAEEQLALWKLVSDSVWSAVSQQAKAEAEQKALKKAQAKKAPKRKGMGIPKPKVVPPPPKLPTPKPNPQLATTKPVAKAATPIQANVGGVVGVHRKSSADMQQLTNPQQPLGSQQSAKKSLKSGVLTK